MKNNRTGKREKRERNANFTREETEQLISLVEAYRNIIESKKCDAVTWHQKEKAWNAIEKEFNDSGNETFRGAKHLKLKYEALKRDIRKKISNICAEHCQTGGGTIDASLLTPGEQRVKDIILSAAEGGDSNYDSDPLEIQFENVIKKRCARADRAAAGSSERSDPYNQETPQSDGVEWGPTVKQKKLSTFSVQNEKPEEEDQLEIVNLQKRLIEEELEERLLKKQLLINEIQHKTEMYELEKEEMLLKIEILNKELHNKNK